MKIDNILENVFRRLLVESKEINVFDFDDTLVRTESYIYMTSQDGKTVKMTPAEYAVYESEPGDQFDFSDFQRVLSPTPITGMITKLKQAIQDWGNENVFILTARGDAEPIRNFLDGLGIEGIRIDALGSSNPYAKAAVIRDEAQNLKRGTIKFFDDSPKNIRAVRKLKDDPKVPKEVEIVAVKVG